MKKIIFLIAMIAIAFVSNAQIAANTTWTYIGRLAELPTTVVNPVAPKISPFEPYYVDLSFDATTYDNNTQNTAFQAIGTQVKATITPTYLDATVGLDTSDIATVRLGIMSFQRVFNNIGLRDKVNIFKEAEDIFLVRVRIEVTRDPE